MPEEAGELLLGLMIVWGLPLVAKSQCHRALMALSAAPGILAPTE